MKTRTQRNHQSPWNKRNLVETTGEAKPMTAGTAAQIVDSVYKTLENVGTSPLVTLANIGAALVHADEVIDSLGHTSGARGMDAIQFKVNFEDPGVKAFLSYLDAQALLPLRRDGKRYTT